MIIEAAFWKLLGVFLRESSPEQLLETTIVGYLSAGLRAELAVHGETLSIDKIKLEWEYSALSNEQPNWRVDMYVELPIPFTKTRWALYGVKPENWIEVKFFSSADRNAQKPSKGRNAADIVLDLLRLCLLIEEHKGTIRDKERYLVLLFNREPGFYLPFYKKDGSRREWLHGLLEPGTRDVHITVEEEPHCVKAAMGVGFASGGADLKLDLNITVQGFAPITTSANYGKPLFWGYLIRLDEFVVSLSGSKLYYSPIRSPHWGAETIRTQKALIEKFIECRPRRRRTETP